MKHLLIVVIGALVWCASGGQAQERVQAYVGARIIPIEGGEIPAGVLLVQRGKILAVGPSDTVDIPADANTVDLTGKVILPGLICTHSHIGGIGGADGSGPIQPDVRVYDSIDVLDPGFRRAVAGGLTSLNIMPGSGHLMSGQTVYVKLRHRPKTIEDIAYQDDEGKILGGMKMANGTNSMKAPPFPGTRGKSAALVRQKFIEAQEYREKLQRGLEDPNKAPARDIGMEALVEVLEGTPWSTTTPTATMTS